MRARLRNRLSRPLWFVLAALFLFEAWLWDELGALLKKIAGRIPFESLKAALARAIEVLPAPAVLAVFLVPIALIEPFKIAGLWLIANRHIVSGIGAFLAAKVLGLGVAAFLFDATRGKLLTMGWFARFYAWVIKLRAAAHAFLEPYKQRVRAALAPFREKLRAALAALRSQGGLGRRLAILRARARRLRGLT
ncbi:MAG TPA: hypothetical protein VKV77_01240 [Methylovirgula sp.]|nr:hypothetical protein [Methylovirgula sp.]